MKTCLNILSLLLLITAASGCAKIRELTRRDYAMLRDPFAAKTTVAENEESAPPVDATVSTSGYVKIGDTQADPAARPAKADYSAVAGMNPAEASTGSKFPGIRVRGMGNSISSEVGTSAARSAAADGEADYAQLSEKIPETSAATTAGFDNFANRQTASLSTEQNPRPESGGMVEWMSTERKRWEAEKQAVVENASPFANPIQQVSKTVSHDTAAAEPAGQSPSPFAELETAQPLIRSAGATPLIRKEHSIQAPTPKSKPAEQPPADSPNPFAELQPKPVQQKQQTLPAPDFDDFQSARSQPDSSGPNPFAAFEQAQPKNTNSQATKQKTLDSGFNFDTGWRPADAELP